MGVLWSPVSPKNQLPIVGLYFGGDEHFLQNSSGLLPSETSVFHAFSRCATPKYFFSTKKKIGRVFICNRTPIHGGRHQNQKFVGNETPY
jgi:hypothetical protein